MLTKYNIGRCDELITNYPACLMHLLCVFIPAYPTWSVDNKVRLLILKNGILVKVGSIPHPMTQEHSIKFIQVEKDGVTYTRHLVPTDKPEAEFAIEYSDDLIAREFCDLHGLWIND